MRKQLMCLELRRTVNAILGAALGKTIDSVPNKLILKMLMLHGEDLTLHPNGSRGPIVVLGEVLWDIFADSACLGGAPLNFAVNARRLGYYPILISAVGQDTLGERAAGNIRDLGLDVEMLHSSAKWKTGTASVQIDGSGQPTFRIERPAAYDDVRLTANDIRHLADLKPSWLYHGTLFPSAPEARTTLQRLIDALPQTTRFYDVNLRPGFDSLELVAELIATAEVVKLNEFEAESVSAYLELPSNLEGFCRSGAARFGWRAVCITLGERGCAMFDGADFITAGGRSIEVADTVGAGDAFAAAFMHGLEQGWPLAEIAEFANRVGALVASRTGAIPDWTVAETASL
jgi:fructokinase